MSSFTPNSEFAADHFLICLSKLLICTECTQNVQSVIQAVIEQTGFLGSIIQVQLSSTSTQKGVKYGVTKVFVIFSYYLIDINMSKKHGTIINILRKNYSVQRSVILGASLTAFHTQGLKLTFGIVCIEKCKSMNQFIQN